jgi:hypothetical protein
MSRRTPLPPVFNDQPFSRREAVAAGVTDRRLAAADLRKPFHGARIAQGLPYTLEWRCLSYRRVSSVPFAFSHVTAALLLGLPVPAYAIDDRIHVTVCSPATPPYGRGVVGHQLNPALWRRRSFVHSDPTTHELFELPVLAPAVVLAQLSASLDADDVIAVGDAVVARDGTGEVNDLASRWGGRRGARALLRATSAMREGSRSRPESLQRRMFVRAGIPEPLPNVAVFAPDGRRLWTPDHVWPEYRVLSEYEGDGHRVSRAKFRSDIARFEEYVDGGWSPLRAQAADVFDDPNPFIARLWRRLVGGGWRPALREPRHIYAARR